MQLSATVNRPIEELSKPAVTGLQCTRIEQSGKRLWGLIRQIAGTPEQFSKQCFVHNYCPLAFFQNGGKNITPAELRVSMHC